MEPPTDQLNVMCRSHVPFAHGEVGSGKDKSRKLQLTTNISISIRRIIVDIKVEQAVITAIIGVAA